MLGLKYTGAILDNSGYGNACRNYIGALLETSGVNLTARPVSFEQNKTSQGLLLDKIKPYINKQIPYGIHIVHLTPDNYPSTLEKGKYNIGYTVWETDRLPHKWVDMCNLMNEIWVPSEWNVQVFKKSGVRVPVYKILHGIEVPDLAKIGELKITENDDDYLFYSIFQWIERKNPAALLKAYLTEFDFSEKVCLALKSYRLDTSHQEQEVVRNSIRNIKASLRLDKYPPIIFFGELLPYEYIQRLHNRGDCFVLPHRGEGFSITHAEAMSFGKPAIGTQYGGNLEFMNESNSYLITYQETPVSDMIFPNYHGYMTWAEPSIMHLRKIMRHVFNNREEAKLKGQKARKDIEEKLNWRTIGNSMLDRLKEIQKGI